MSNIYIKTNILGVGLFALVLSGCSEKAQIDQKEIAVIDAYLNDVNVVAFHEQLKSSRENIIKTYEKEFKKAHVRDVSLNLIYNKKTYDPDFENEVEIKLSSDIPLRVKIKGLFVEETVYVKDKFSKKYLVKGIGENKLKVELVKVLPPNSDYKIKNYAKLSK